MTTDIYYFSGTGNSLAIARGIAEKTGGTLISIPSVMDNESISIDTEVTGVVFPVYHGNIPLILNRFFEKMEGLDKKYIFGVCTYGDSPGLAVKYLGKLVRSRGGQLAAGFAVNMPYNYLTPSPVLRNFFSSFTLREIPPEKQKTLFARGSKKVESIAAYVRAGESGTFENSTDLPTRIADFLNLKELLAKPVWLKIAGVNEKTGLSFLESRQLMDRAFHVDERCNGCKICSGVCPVGNIRMVDSKPVWQHRCEQCFACLQWCPREALQFGGNTSGRKRYHHPGVKPEEMLKQVQKRNNQV